MIIRVSALSIFYFVISTTVAGVVYCAIHNPRHSQSIAIDIAPCQTGMLSVSDEGTEHPVRKQIDCPIFFGESL